jgi:hypothetical protein
MHPRPSFTGRLTVMSLSSNPNPTQSELLWSTAAKTPKHLNRLLTTVQITILGLANVRTGPPTTYTYGGGK